MAISSGINLSSLSKQTNQANKGLSKTRGTILGLNKIVFNRSKNKNNTYSQIKILRNKRIEYQKRAELEDQLEAPTLVTQPKGSEQLIKSDTSKGFLDRIIGFIGYISAGWILRNLPTWIGMGKEFIARINKAGQIFSGMFENITGMFRGITDVIGGYAKNLASFDFFDTQGRVRSAMDELNQSFGLFQNKLEEALGLVTTPLTEGRYSGQNIPSLGSDSQDQGAYTESYTPSSGGGGGGGGWKPILDLIAQAESSGGSYDSRYGGIYPGYSKLTIAEADRVQRENYRRWGSAASGRYQFMNIASQAADAGLKPTDLFSPENQDKMAISLIEKKRKITLSMIKNNPREAQLRLAQEWAGIPIPGSESSYYPPPNKATVSNAQVKKAFEQVGSSSSQQQTTGQSNIVSSGRITAPEGFQPTFIQGTTGRSTGPHFHFGPGTANNKVAQQGDVFPGKFYSDVREVAFNVGKTFLGKKMSFLLSRSNRWIYPGISDSDLKNALYTEQQVHTQRGSDGGIDMALSGNVKLPLAVSDVKDYGDGFGISGTIVGTNVFVGHGAFGSTSSSSRNIVSQAPSTPAQVSPSPSTQQRQGVPAAITPERKPQDIMVYSPPNQQNIINSSSGGEQQQTSSPINDFDLLNNFIKNKLLLDLAYL